MDVAKMYYLPCNFFLYPTLGLVDKEICAGDT